MERVCRSATHCTSDVQGTRARRRADRRKPNAHGCGARSRQDPAGLGTMSTKLCYLVGVFNGINHKLSQCEALATLHFEDNSGLLEKIVIEHSPTIRKCPVRPMPHIRLDLGPVFGRPHVSEVLVLVPALQAPWVFEPIRLYEGRRIPSNARAVYPVTLDNITWWRSAARFTQ